MEHNMDMIGHKLLDAKGQKWEIVNEYVWKMGADMFDKNRKGIESRYIAAINVLACKMQIAEDRRHASDKRYFGAVVPKLSPEHLKDIASEGDDSQLFEKLRIIGITTDWEYKLLMETSSGKPRDVSGCTRFYLDTWDLFSDVKVVATDVRKYGPVFGNFYSYDTMKILGMRDGYYRPLGSKTSGGVKNSERVVEEPVLQSVTILGFGKCVRNDEEEEYFVVQNTNGTADSESGGRINFGCFHNAFSPVIPADED